MLRGTIKYLFMASLMVAGTTAAFGADKPSPQKTSTPYKIEQLNREQFKALPDNAVVERNGKTMSKKQFIAAEKRSAKALRERKMPQIRAKLKAAADSENAKFLKEQRAQLDAENTRRLKEEKARRKNVKSQTHSPQYLAIRKETMELHTKYQQATPAEREKIDKRAGELTAQLKRMGY
jgi:hypothetical protein